MNSSIILNKLQKTRKEKEVENVINSFLGISDKIKLDANTDGIYKHILFEYKFNYQFCEDGKWSKNAYIALAQSIYYLKILTNMQIYRVEKLPSIIAIIDNFGAFIVPTQKLEGILDESWLDKDGIKIDWNLRPSNPDIKLVNWLKSLNYFHKYSVDYWIFNSEEILKNFKVSVLNANLDPAKIEITQDNFDKIFLIWKDIFWDNEPHSKKLADNYVLDINLKFDYLEKRGFLYNIENQEEWHVPIEKYNYFWKHYKRPPRPDVQEFILHSKDRLYDKKILNDTGDYYTPLRVAKLAGDYLNRILDKDVKYNALWWDPAAGGANLFIYTPKKDNIILSTLDKIDLKTLESMSIFKESTIVQMNFLKDEIPKPIKIQMKDFSKTPLIFLLNPPFNDQSGHSGGKKVNPNQVDEMFITEMDQKKISLRNIRSTYAKFMYKIHKICEEENRLEVYIGIFTPSAWLSGPDFTPFRVFWANLFNFENGFIVPCSIFPNLKDKKWPVLFSIWRKISRNNDSNCKFKFDIYDENINKIGIKNFYMSVGNQIRISDTIDKSCLKLLNEIEFPPMKNECELYTDERIYLSSLHESAIGYLRTIGNDVANSSSGVQLYSAPYGGSNHNGVSIVKENFESALNVYGIRKSIKHTWINNKDEFLLDKEKLNSKEYNELKRMSVLWSILDGGYTCSLRNFKWKSKRYNIFNGFFALDLKTLKRCHGAKIELMPDIEPLAAMWINSNQNNFNQTEKEALYGYINLIRTSLNSGCRNGSDPKRQAWNPDASPRQIINGVFKFSDARISNDDKESLDNYKKYINLLSKKIKELVLDLKIIIEHEEFAQDLEEINEQNFKHIDEEFRNNILKKAGNVLEKAKNKSARKSN